MHFKQLIALNICLVAAFACWISFSHYYNQYPAEPRILSGKHHITVPSFTEEEEEEPTLVDFQDISFMDTHQAHG